MHTRRYGFNVWACDADAVLVGDPRPLMHTPDWKAAHVAAATDCIDIPLDNRFPLLHCDLNTGLVFLRSTPEVRRPDSDHDRASLLTTLPCACVPFPAGCTARGRCILWLVVVV